jgi:hypothetical protein
MTKKKKKRSLDDKKGKQVKTKTRKRGSDVGQMWVRLTDPHILPPDLKGSPPNRNPLPRTSCALCFLSFSFYLFRKKREISFRLKRNSQHHFEK